MTSVILEGIKDTYKILISYNAQCEIEEMLGKTVYQIMMEPVSAKNMRTIFMVGLRYGEARKINLAETGEIIDDIAQKHGIPYFEEKITNSMVKALGIEDKEEDQEEGEGEEEGK